MIATPKINTLIIDEKSLNTRQKSVKLGHFTTSNIHVHCICCLTLIYLNNSGTSYSGKSTTVFKSEKRQELKDEGYRIHGNSGHQWSDLWGFATAKRSFKLPNPMYYIP